MNSKALLGAGILMIGLGAPVARGQANPTPIGVEAGRPSPAPLLPEAVASFGAATSGGWLYVYGGHTGRAHEHSRDNLSPAFRRLNLLDRSAWEELPQGPPLQGLGLVAGPGGVVRVGGLSALNRRGEPDDLHSVAEVARYLPLEGRWEALPALPEPRSSHDAALLGDRLYVVGGWNLQGSEKSWHQSALVLDLGAREPRWEKLPEPPFSLRALAIAAVEGKLFAIGGMDRAGRRSQSVHTLDIAKGAWSQGPDLPEEGFGPSALAVDGKIYASGAGGTLFRLNEAAGRWDPAGTLCFPRFFHRLAAGGRGELLAVGGAGGGTHLRAIESLPVGDDAAGPRPLAWTIPFPGKAKSRQGIFLTGNDLYLFGGNTSLEQHDFNPENFLSDAYRVNLGSLKVESMKDLPVKRQSQSTVVVNGGPKDSLESGRGKGTGYAIGGFGHDGKAARSHDQVFSYQIDSGVWKTLDVRLPRPLTQLGLAQHGSTLWVFGGLDYDPGRTGEPFQFPQDVLTLSLDEPTAFKKSEHQLPRLRRAFGGAALGNKYYLVGGMRKEFKDVEECDVFDFETGRWETIPSPSRSRISPELVAVGGKLYLGGGASRNEKGKVVPNQSLECFDPETGKWSMVMDTLPLPAEHLRILELRDRLLLCSTYNDQADALSIVILKPQRAKPEVAEAPAR